MDEAGRVLAEALEPGRYDAPWQIAQAHAVLSDVQAAAGDDMAARAPACEQTNGSDRPAALARG
jgi:hypothetical protein